MLRDYPFSSGASELRVRNNKCNSTCAQCVNLLLHLAGGKQTAFWMASPDTAWALPPLVRIHLGLGMHFQKKEAMDMPPRRHFGDLGHCLLIVLGWDLISNHNRACAEDCQRGAIPICRGKLRTTASDTARSRIRNRSTRKTHSPSSDDRSDYSISAAVAGSDL
jgi:hypothetical protein